jgi:restriction system protein
MTARLLLWSMNLMPIPDYQSLMHPVLRTAGDEQEHSLSDAFQTLAEEFRLSSEERNKLLPSGRQPVFENRVGWAITYLKKAGLLESRGRGRFRITPRGLDVLRSNPPRIDVRFLVQFPEFVQFRSSRSAESDEAATEAEPETPEETLEVGYRSLLRNLVEELLDRVKKSSPKFFEKLVVDLLVAMGYGGSRRDAAQAVGQTGDDGIDGIINEDKLGLDVVYVQAKRWGAAVGRPIVQAFAGSLEGHRAKKGVLITTSYFTQDAREYVTRIEKKIVLIDGEQLAELMIEYGVGVTQVAKYDIKKVDFDYFQEE